jgi:hypothetical protein
MGDSQYEMDEDAKVHWAETVDNRYRQFTISGNPGSLVERQKSV